MSMKRTAMRAMVRGRRVLRHPGTKMAGAAALGIGSAVGAHYGLFKLGESRGRRRTKPMTAGRRWLRSALLPRSYTVGYEHGLGKRG